MTLFSRLVTITFAAALLAGAANAGTVCRGSVITGFERQAQIAAAVLGEPTSDPALLRVYSTHSANGYYYESNFVRPGQHGPTKIVSDVPMTRRQVVINMMFVSQAEVAANAAATEVAMNAVDYATTMLASIE